MSADGPIFDLHQHYGALIGVPGVDATAAPPLGQDCESRVAFMDRFGIAAAALMPGHTYIAPRGLVDVQAINDGLAAYHRLAPERFPAVFGTLDPRHGRANLAEVERLAGLGFRGLSWHHRLQGLPMDHPTMAAVVERMDAHGMVGLFHCYASADFEAPWRLRRLAERFPGTTFVALDAMTSPENLEQLLAVAEACANVFIDLTTTLLGARGVSWAIERIGASRLVFGTNFYSMSRPARIGALEALDDAGVSAADRRAILWGNARRLLGL